jgi:hypothetical protein
VGNGRRTPPGERKATGDGRCEERTGKTVSFKKESEMITIKSGVTEVSMTPEAWLEAARMYFEYKAYFSKNKTAIERIRHVRKN